MSRLWWLFRQLRTLKGLGICAGSGKRSSLAPGSGWAYGSGPLDACLHAALRDDTWLTQRVAIADCGVLFRKGQKP